MKTPTLEEVKEHFKNAKEVESIYGKVFNYDKSKNIHKWDDGFYCTDEELEYRCLWYCDKGYAKIISYKEPTYTITKEQLTYLHSVYSIKETIEEWFPNEFLKPIEVTLEEIAKLKGCNVEQLRIKE